MPASPLPSPHDTLRWTFTRPTPLGDTRLSYAIGDAGLVFESDDLFGGGSETVAWASVREGGTAAMTGMGGRGAPDLPRWVPAGIEWLALSRTTGGPGFMRMLPQGPDRDAIVAAVRERLGPRWIGEGIPIQEVRKKLGLAAGEWSTLKVVGIVVAVLALLVLLLFVVALLAHPLFWMPAGVVIAGWLIRRALGGLRAAATLADTPVSQVGSAKRGLVALHGRATTPQPSPSAISGRPCVWWDVSVQLWYDDRDEGGEWRQVAARHGGTIGVVDLEDGSGRVPVWLKDADLLLDRGTWESSRDALPAAGVALLDELGFAWTGGQRIRVIEACVEADAMLHVLGTLDQRIHVRTAQEEGALERIGRLLRTGQWRRELVAAVPQPARVTVAVLIGFLDMLTQIGRGGERVQRAETTDPPAISPGARMVWKGREGRPFVVSNQPVKGALDALRKRSLVLGGIGVGVLLFVLFELVDMF